MAGRDPPDFDFLYDRATELLLHHEAAAKAFRTLRRRALKDAHASAAELARIAGQT